MMALGLLGWSLLALRQRRLLPRLPRPWRAGGPLAAAAALALLGYWLARLHLQTFPPS